MMTLEQDGAGDVMRSSYDEMYDTTTSTQERSRTWKELEQRQKVLEEFNKLEIDVSLSRKEAAEHGQYCILVHCQL